MLVMMTKKMVLKRYSEVNETGNKVEMLDGVPVEQLKDSGMQGTREC